MIHIAEQELVRLTPQERLTLIERLWDSLADSDVPVTGVQQAEIDRRMADFAADSAHAVSWDELKTELLKRTP